MHRQLRLRLQIDDSLLIPQFIWTARERASMTYFTIVLAGVAGVLSFATA